MFRSSSNFKLNLRGPNQIKFAWKEDNGRRPQNIKVEISWLDIVQILDLSLSDQTNAYKEEYLNLKLDLTQI